MKDTIEGILMLTLCAGYILGPIFGLYAAVANSSFLNALASIFIPWYGMVYWFFS